MLYYTDFFPVVHHFILGFPEENPPYRPISLLQFFLRFHILYLKVHKERLLSRPHSRANESGGIIMASMQVYCSLNSNLSITAHEGHFATRHRHISHFLDITEVKHQHLSARTAAMELAALVMLTNVDTIVCLGGSEVVGTFLARHLAKKELLALNSDKNINVITPEYDSNGQMFFRENILPMLKGKDILVMISTINSGKAIHRALECIAYYGGKVQGVTAIFSTAVQVEGRPVYTLFSPSDIPGYINSAPETCPMCAAGQKIDALVNYYGLSAL